MLKVVVLCNRKAGMSREDFAKYWLNIHAAKSKKIHGLRKSTVNLLSPEGGGEGLYDGIAELWYDDMDAWRKALESPEGKESGKDADNFIGKMLVFYAEEYNII